MDAKMRWPPPPTPVASAVFGDDDLLREILLRLDLPPCLVRAALVSKRWLRAASDPAFLRHFRQRHPPRLLGFVAAFQSAMSSSLRFVPTPDQPPELAGAARRAAAAFHDSLVVVDCRNGRLLVKAGRRRDTDTYAVRCPLCPARGTAIAPPLPPLAEANTCHQFALLPDSDGGGDDDDGNALCYAITSTSPYNGLTYMPDVRKLCMPDVRKLFAQVCVLQAGAWVSHTSAPFDQLPHPPVFHEFPYSLLVGGNLYMVTLLGYIIGFDLAAASFFLIELPDGVVCENGSCMDHRLARKGNSGLYLVHAKGLELHIWLWNRSGGGGGVGGGNWELVDIVSLPKVFCDHLAKPFWDSVGAHQFKLMDEDEDWGRYSVEILAVGDDAEFAFLTVCAGGGVFYLDIKRRTVEKVLQTSEHNGYLCQIFPFMMPWPPVFPAGTE